VLVFTVGFRSPAPVSWEPPFSRFSSYLLPFYISTFSPLWLRDKSSLRARPPLLPLLSPTGVHLCDPPSRSGRTSDGSLALPDPSFPFTFESRSGPGFLFPCSARRVFFLLSTVRLTLSSLFFSLPNQIYVLFGRLCLFPLRIFFLSFSCPSPLKSFGFTLTSLRALTFSMGFSSSPLLRPVKKSLPTTFPPFPSLCLDVAVEKFLWFPLPIVSRCFSSFFEIFARAPRLFPLLLFQLFLRDLFFYFFFSLGGAFLTSFFIFWPGE